MSRSSNTSLAIVIASILICVLVPLVLALEFGYGESYGPEQWGECSGKHHSPLTIDLVNAVEKNFTDLEIINFNVVPRTFEMSNNGHTILVKMSFNKETVPTVKGGPFAERTPLGYQFEQFHFYWGDNETFTNKDMVINQAYLFELHLVLRNSEYPNLTIAMEKDHGIAVMAFYFHIGLVPFRGYEDFTNLLAQIDRKGQSVNMKYPFPLGEYISKHMDNYFTYSDSLTIPPCSVEATWLYFPYTIDISEDSIYFTG
nr:carbonic anhydrase-related protein-like isoform X2 [Drosophila suzukii]